MTMTKNTKTQLPTLNGNPEYAAAATRLAELKAERVALESEYESTLNQLNELANGSFKGLNVDPIESAALRLISGDNTPAPSRGGAISSLQEKLGESGDRLRVVERAILIQQKAVSELLNTASQQAEQIVRPTHRELVRGIVVQLRGLDEAMNAERKLRMTMEDEGFLVFTRPMPLNGHGLLSDQYSRASYYLLECEKFGFVDISELPDNLQNSVPSRNRKPQPKETIPVLVDNDGWGLA